MGRSAQWFHLEMEQLAAASDRTLADIEAGAAEVRGVSPVFDGLGRVKATMEHDGLGGGTGQGAEPPHPVPCHMGGGNGTRGGCPLGLHPHYSPARPALARLWCEECECVERSRRVFEAACEALRQDRRSAEGAKDGMQAAVAALSQRVAALPTGVAPDIEADIGRREEEARFIGKDVADARNAARRGVPALPQGVVAASRGVPPPPPEVRELPVRGIFSRISRFIHRKLGRRGSTSSPRPELVEGRK